METIKPMMSQEEIKRFIELGLGRGIDATNISPWINKSSFQVRNPTPGNLIGTDEGGLLQSYKSSISSIIDLQAELKESVSNPNTPISLGLEGEMSRSFHSSRRAVGRKVINRTVSFRIDYADNKEYDKSTPDLTKKESLASIQLQPTFEEFLSQWILKRINDHRRQVTEMSKIKEEGITALSDYLRSASKEEAGLVVDDCSNFIHLHGVTHYVNSISLGASEHTVLTESQYSQVVKKGFDISIFGTRFRSSKTIVKVQMLGKIVNEKVEKSSGNEAVVEIKILPLHSLIQQSNHLHLAMQKALTKYTEEKSIQPSKYHNTI